MVHVSKCAVKGCNFPDQKRFHFPRTLERAEEWRKLCSNPQLYDIPLNILFTRARVCRRHFALHQFTNERMDKINRNASPSLLLPSARASKESNVRKTSTPTVEVQSKVFPPAGLLHLCEVPGGPSERTAKEEAAKDVAPTPQGCVESSAKAFPDDSGLESNFPAMESVDVRHETEIFSIPISGYYRYTLCRICFSFDDFLMDIFKEDDPCGFVIKDAMEDLLQFKVSKTDEYPQYVCLHCLRRLAEFKRFKDKFLKAKEVFEEKLKELWRSNCEEDTDTPDSAFAGFEKNAVTLASDDSPTGDIAKQPPVENPQECMETTGESMQRPPSPVETEEASQECLEPTENIFQDPDGQGNEDDVEEQCASDAGVEEDSLELESRTLKSGLDCVEVVLEEEFKCRQCGEVFQYRNHLSKHLKEHMSTWPLPCQYCPRRFKTLNDLNSHITLHSDYKPFECEHCGLRCRLKTTLLMHKTTHSGLKPFLCSTCGLTFANRLLLRKHLLGHSKQKQFRCDECGREFTKGHQFLSHYRSHTGERPYVCGECGKSFTVRTRLNRHMMCMHTAEKPFQCDFCDKRFSLRQYLRDHHKIHLSRANHSVK